MKMLAETLPTAATLEHQARANGQELQSSNQPKNSVTLIDDAQARKELSNFLFQCFDALKVYGKEPEQMKNLNSMFQLVLADYTLEQVKRAFAYYLKHNSELPAPADIANLIERGCRPPLERSVYVSISKKDASDRTAEEWQYIREYEYFQLTGKHKDYAPVRTVVPSKPHLIDGYSIDEYGAVHCPNGDAITLEEYRYRVRMNYICAPGNG